MSEFLSTVMAVAITLAVCFFMVRSQVKYDEKQDRIEEEKRNKLKCWLDRCAQSRKNDRN